MSSETNVTVFQAAYGDIDGDRDVDIFDLLKIKTSLKGFGTGATDAEWIDGDMAGFGPNSPANGIVDIWDILAIKQANKFGTGEYAASVQPGDQTAVTSAVPEPGTLAMLAMGLLGLLIWRRKRAT